MSKTLRILEKRFKAARRTRSVAVGKNEAELQAHALVSQPEKIAGISIGHSGSLKVHTKVNPHKNTDVDTDVSGLPLHFAIANGGTSIGQVTGLAPMLEISEEELALRCGLSRSTFHRRKKAKGKLSTSESDALARHALLLKQATDVFEGDEMAARTWLKTTQVGLGNHIPLDLARTTSGFREVEKLLTRIDQGVYA